MATSEMVGLPGDGAGPGGQYHAAELANHMLGTQFGCGVEDDSYTITVTEADLVISYPALVAVVPDGSGSFVLVNVSASTTNVTTGASNPRTDILVVDSAGTVAITDGTPTAESSGSTTITDIDSVLGIVAEAPMPALANDEIMLAKIRMGASDTVITAARVQGRAVHTDIYRVRHLTGWVADDAQNPSLTNETGSNNLPVGIFADIPILDVIEAFDGDGDVPTGNAIAVGYDADTDAFGDETDVSTTGVKNMPAGTLEGYVDTVRAVEAYFTNSGSEPTAGKAIVDFPYRFLPPIVS